MSRARPDSIYRVWFKSFSLLLVLFFVLFITFATAIIFTRANRNISSLLERAQTISWSVYDQYFVESKSGLAVLAGQLERGEMPDYKALSPMLDGLAATDLWFVTDQDGGILLSSSQNDAAVLRQLAKVVQPAWQAGTTVTSSEVVSLEHLRAFSPWLAGRAVIDQSTALDRTYGALLQVVAVPYRNGAGAHAAAGALVVAHVLNNDNAIPRQVAEKIPNSFCSVSLDGIRITTNISSRTHPTFLGQLQTPDLITTIQQGRQYFGQVKLDSDFDHLVVADPIRNSRGQVIGAVTTGHPSQGLASLKQDTALYIGLSGLLCWGVVFGGSALASKRWAVPIVNLSKLAKRIYDAETITPEHLSLVGDLPSAKIREIEDLRLGFGRMAVSLYEKNQEILGYLRELELERNQLEARVEEKTLELRNAMSDVVASSNLKSKLLANTSHELRTPLNSIIGFSVMLTGGIYGELTEAQSRRVQIIADSARYLLNLINDLLDVSLVEQGKMVIERREVQLEELIDSVLVIIRSNCDSSISIRTEKTADLPPLSVDPVRIKQVFYNVLSNAVKFTESGGEILVRLETQPGEVIVSVTDTGIGISENDQLYVFDEFYQGENAGDRKQAGFGLGLPLSKKLVLLHEGRIELRSALGEGTTVTIYLPIGKAGTTEFRPAG